jgi:hypothetical protein
MLGLGLAGITLLVGVFLGVIVGIVVCVGFMRAELRTAQRGVEEARAALVAAGLGHLVPSGSESVPATPATCGEEVTP